MSDSLSKLFAAFAYLIVSLSVIAIPFLASAPAIQKGILAAFAFGILLIIAAGILAWSRAHMSLSIPATTVLGLLFFLVAAVSSTRALSPHHAWWGLEFEIGTVGALALFVAAMAAGAQLSSSRIVRALNLFIVMTIAVCVYTIARVASGSIGEETAVGSWTTLSLLIAAGMTTAAMLADRSKTIRLSIAYWSGLAMLCIGFVLFFHADVALITLIACLFACVLASGPAHNGFRIPFATVTLTAIVLFSVLSMHASLVTLPLEVRPTMFAVELVMVPAFFHNTESMLLGTGANNFRNTWNQYRVQDINAMSFWNMEPTKGFSTFTSFGIAFGLLGILPILLMLGALIYLSGRVIVERFQSGIPLLFDTRTISLVVSVFAFTALLFVAPDIVFFLFAGLMFGCATATVLMPIATMRIPRSALLRIPLALLPLGVGVLFVWVASHQLVAAHCFDAGVQARTAGDRPAAAQTFDCAAEYWHSSLYQYEASHAWLEVAKMQSQNPDRNEALLRKTIEHAASLADHAVDADLNDYAAWLSRAFVYIAVMRTGFPEAEPRVRESLDQARQHAPTRPDVPFLQAQFELTRHDVVAAKRALQHALKLKPDYEPALALLKSLSETVH